MKKRLTYEAPEGELIIVRFEERFLQATGGQTSLDGMLTGNPGSSYNGDAFDSNENHHTL